MLACILSGTRAYAGHWDSVTVLNGTDNANPTSPAPPTSTPWNQGNTGGNVTVGTGFDEPASASASGTVTVTFTWVPANANDKPPKKMCVYELGTASYGYTGNGPSAAVTGTLSVGMDGTGETTGAEGNYTLRKVKVSEVDSASGIVVRSCALSSSVSGDGREEFGGEDDDGFPIPHIYTLYLTTQNSFSAGIYDKGLMITSSRDTTHHRDVVNGVGVAVPDLPDEDGITHANTRGNRLSSVGWLAETQYIHYAGNHYGSWSDTCTYEWSWSHGHPDPLGYYTSGRWSGVNPLFGILALYMMYEAPNEGMPDAECHIHLKATDVGDGNIVRETDYYMKFHAEFEDISTLHHEVLPEDPTDEETLPIGWHSLRNFNAGEPAQESLSIATETGSEASVEVGSGTEFTKILNLKGVIKASSKTTITVPLNFNDGIVPAGQIWKYYYAANVDKFDGTASWWDEGGYVQDASWNALDYAGTLKRFKFVVPLTEP